MNKEKLCIEDFFEKENIIYVSTVYQYPEWTMNNIIYLKGGDIKFFSIENGQIKVIS